MGDGSFEEELAEDTCSSEAQCLSDQMEQSHSHQCSEGQMTDYTGVFMFNCVICDWEE